MKELFFQIKKINCGTRNIWIELDMIELPEELHHSRHTKKKNLNVHDHIT